MFSSGFSKMENWIRETERNYEDFQEELLKKELDKWRSQMSEMDLAVCVGKELRKFSVNLTTNYELNTNHYIYTNKCFKAKSCKELGFVPYHAETFEYFDLDFSSLFKVTPFNYNEIYGEYPCKLLCKFVENYCEYFKVSTAKAISNLEISLKVLIKPCVKAKFQSSPSISLCQTCYKYACLTHPSRSKPFLPQILLSLNLSELKIYKFNWKGKFLFNEYQSEKAMRWTVVYKCPAHTKTPIFSMQSEIERLIQLNITNPCCIALILNIPCPILPEFEISCNTQKMPAELSVFNKKLPMHNTASNCKCITCDESCICLQGLLRSEGKYFESRGYCEKYCSCSFTCPYKFLGCVCTSSCRSDSCICYRNQIECDPILCRTCKSHNELLTGIESCNNLRVQRNLKTRTFLGISTLPGAGAGVFSSKSLIKGDFINEYTGELITDQESNRRGCIYDQSEHSFIFNIDNMHSIDATYFGNKTRYINHKSDSQANCSTQIWRVKGQSKILIFAKKKIPALEELFFDYKYPASVSYSWFQNYLIK